ncbi:unnamed protein product, partial [Rotaria sp. Silwood1]
MFFTVQVGVTPTKDFPVLHGRTIKLERLHPLWVTSD